LARDRLDQPPLRLCQGISNAQSSVRIARLRVAAAFYDSDRIGGRDKEWRRVINYISWKRCVKNILINILLRACEKVVEWM